MSEITDAEIAAQLRKLLNAYPLGTMDWPLDVMTNAAEALERRASSPADPTIVEAALRTIAAGKVPKREWLSLIECIEDFAKTALGILEPWKRCPSTHCNRRGECASPSDCTVKSPAVPSPAAGRDAVIEECMDIVRDDGKRLDDCGVPFAIAQILERLDTLKKMQP